MTRDAAIRATKTGTVAACTAGMLNLAVILLAITRNSTGPLAYWNDPFLALDVILIFMCAYGIHRKSRFAAVFTIGYCIVAMIAIGIDAGSASGIGIGIALVFSVFFAHAARGTFAFHRIERVENPNYKPISKWVYWIGIPLIAVFTLFVGFGLMVMMGFLPSTEVQSGHSMPKAYQTKLIENNIVTDEDEIIYFYSDGVLSILEGGSVLTDDRVITYLPDDNGGLDIYEIYHDEIASVELVSIGDFFNDSIYRINSFEPENWLQIPLSTENQGDVLFIEALRSKI